MKKASLRNTLSVCKEFSHNFLQPSSIQSVSDYLSIYIHIEFNPIYILYVLYIALFHSLFPPSFFLALSLRICVNCRVPCLSLLFNLVVKTGFWLYVQVYDKFYDWFIVKSDCIFTDRNVSTPSKQMTWILTTSVAPWRALFFIIMRRFFEEKSERT